MDTAQVRQEVPWVLFQSYPQGLSLLLIVVVSSITEFTEMDYPWTMVEESLSIYS